MLAQDYPAIEYIVMDGGSTDETAAVVSEYAGRLTFISEKDRGQSHAINKGFKMARGEIVAWLNSDDVFLPGAVSTAVAAFADNPQAGAVYGEGNLIDYHGNVKGRFPATEPFNLWKLVHLSDYILQQTVYFRRSVFDEIGFVDENLYWGMDWDLLIRIGKRFPMVYVPADIGALREYGEAKTFSGGFRRWWELVRIMRRHGSTRFPPGAVTYGLDTLYRTLARVVRNPTLQRLASRGVYGTIDWILRNSQGLYRDGWASTRLHYMLPAGRGRVRITGLLPDERALRGQILEIRCGGTRISRTLQAPGAFDIEVEDWSENGTMPLSIEVRASRSFVPAKSQKGGTDTRRLAYMLTRIERETPPPGGKE